MLFRAADSLAKEKLVSRPTRTQKITNRKEWMLTESGYDRVLQLLNVPSEKKNILLTKSYEVQKIVKKLNEISRPRNYSPFTIRKKTIKVTKESSLRTRGFRQAVIEAYDYKCAVCGLKICTPDFLSWEVEAAHIVPHRFRGKDDLLNGLSLCHIHHWAFDAGWFTLLNNYRIEVSSQFDSLPVDYGKIGNYELLKFTANNSQILLPYKTEIRPHRTAISWHRQNIFHK